jgi:hypothetical protein
MRAATASRRRKRRSRDGGVDDLVGITFVVEVREQSSCEERGAEAKTPGSGPRTDVVVPGPAG